MTNSELMINQHTPMERTPPHSPEHQRLKDPQSPRRDRFLRSRQGSHISRDWDHGCDILRFGDGFEFHTFSWGSLVWGAANVKTSGLNSVPTAPGIPQLEDETERVFGFPQELLTDSKEKDSPRATGASRKFQQKLQVERVWGQPRLATFSHEISSAQTCRDRH
ncbi:hypothetical protein EMPG_09563 [Blastomyces silverae]|uniref:Uncharacterized protein n=1 Tax=Blastomyces silverae TaxID=2060906 RepID=A0A0H1BLB8_9EURO|nr:hypothetical protein EMPG_09563 [Blastomyces silverae]